MKAGWESYGIVMVSKGAHDEIGNHVSVTLKMSVGVNPKTIGKATHES